jgi:hypothetical protein
MTLKIERATHHQSTVIRLIGRLQSENLYELRTQVSDARQQLVMNLEGLTLVDVEAVRYLNECEESGIQLLHCSPYIREWMLREKRWSDSSP